MQGSHQKAMTLFENKGIIVRTLSKYNVFRIFDSYNFKESFIYETTVALNDKRGKSASFLVKDVPLRAYSGNDFFLIYDPEKLDVLMATTTDASVHGSLENSLGFDDKGKPIATGNSSTDYARYKTDREKTTDGIEAKVLRMEKKRQGLTQTNKKNYYRGMDSFGHTELLIKLKEGGNPREAIIGIGVHKKSLARLLINGTFKDFQSWLPELEPLEFYSYDPSEGLKNIPLETINSLEKIYEPIQNSLPDCFCAERRGDYVKVTKGNETPLTLSKWSALALISSSLKYHITDLHCFFARNELQINCNRQELVIDPTEYELDNLIPYLQQLKDATTTEQVLRIELKTLSFIYLRWLFNTQGEEKYKTYVGRYNERVNNLSEINFQQAVDDRGISQFYFESQIFLRGQKADLIVNVAMINGKVKLFGSVNNIEYEYKSSDILYHSLGFSGDGGAIFALEKESTRRIKEAEEESAAISIPSGL